MQHVIATVKVVPGGFELIALCGSAKSTERYNDHEFVPFPFYGGGCAACWSAWCSGYISTMRLIRQQWLESDELEARAEDLDRVRRAEEAARRLNGTHEAPPAAG